MRVIDVDVLNKDLDWYDLDVCGHFGNEFAAGFEAARELVAQAPTIDAEPVRHGRWERLGPNYYRCTACKETTSIFSGLKNYCPNCGAKMDEEVQENDKD